MSFDKVPVKHIEALCAAVKRTHDAYWIDEYDHASIEAHLRRNAWVNAVESYEAALKLHAPALLDAYKRLNASHKGGKAT